MVARQMVVRCSRCGRRYIRSVSNRDRWMFGNLFQWKSNDSLCPKCKNEQWKRDHPNDPTVEDVIRWVVDKVRKKKACQT